MNKKNKQTIASIQAGFLSQVVSQKIKQA